MLSRTTSSILLLRRCQTARSILVAANHPFSKIAATSSALEWFQLSPTRSVAKNESATTTKTTSTMIRCFSNDDSGTHDDFAPQKKAVSDETDEVVAMIQQHVADNPIMLYMKGNPSMPMCGFSAKIVQTLQAEGCDFSSVNVLDYPSIREGVKKFASWPTIPQLYVNGEFIGGTDIVSQMHESGELKELLAEAKASDDGD